MSRFKRSPINQEQLLIPAVNKCGNGSQSLLIPGLYLVRACDGGESPLNQRNAFGIQHKSG